MNFRTGHDRSQLQPQFRCTPKITAIVIEMVSTPAMNNALVKVGDREGHHHQRRAQSAIERRAGKRPSRAEAASVVLCVDGSERHTAT